MDWISFGIGIIYAILSGHYVARGLRTNIQSIGREVIEDVISFDFRIL